MRTEPTYDENGNVVSVKYFNDENQLTMSITYEYNDDDGTVSRSEQHEYDEEGIDVEFLLLILWLLELFMARYGNN